MTRPSIRIERDRSTGQWLVTRYTRIGWSVLARCETESDAHRAAQDIVAHDAR